jgi:hypothetical protein
MMSVSRIFWHLLKNVEIHTERHCPVALATGNSEKFTVLTGSTVALLTLLTGVGITGASGLVSTPNSVLVGIFMPFIRYFVIHSFIQLFALTVLAECRE